MRVALVHYWLSDYRGGERVLAALAEMFPNADIFTHVYTPDRLPTGFLSGHRIITSPINYLPFATHHYKAYLPLMPRACEAFDLSGYDLVISSESGPAKGIICDPDTLHLCYCHSPMRYLWDQRDVYHGAASLPARFAMRLFSHRLRQWDSLSAMRVDAFMANSRFVAGRIAKAYRRDATVIYPPIDIAQTSNNSQRKGLLFVGQLEAYKRPDLALDVADQLGLDLRVVGRGSLEGRLKQQASHRVEFLGHLSDQELASAYQSAEALIFPGVEDFGLVPLEAQSHHLPVIAYCKGGQGETVQHEKTGLLVTQQSVNDFAHAVVKAKQIKWRSTDFDHQVARFSKARFQSEIKRFIETHTGASHASAA